MEWSGDGWRRWCGRRRRCCAAVLAAVHTHPPPLLAATTVLPSHCRLVCNSSVTLLVCCVRQSRAGHCISQDVGLQLPVAGATRGALNWCSPSCGSAGEPADTDRGRRQWRRCARRRFRCLQLAQAAASGLRSPAAAARSVEAQSRQEHALTPCCSCCLHHSTDPCWGRAHVAGLRLLPLRTAHLSRQLALPLGSGIRSCLCDKLCTESVSKHLLISACAQTND